MLMKNDQLWKSKMKKKRNKKMIVYKEGEAMRVVC